MATLIEIYNTFFGSSTLHARCKAAMMKAATYVLNEASNAENHANRVLLAEEVLNNPDGDWCKKAIRRGPLSNTTIQAAGEAATDNDIDYTIAVIWDAIANMLAGV